MNAGKVRAVALGGGLLSMEARERPDAEAAVNQVLLIGALAANAVAPEPWTETTLLAFVVVIAAGLSQRATIHAPRLLDPAAGGPSAS